MERPKRACWPFGAAIVVAVLVAVLALLAGLAATPPPANAGALPSPGRDAADVYVMYFPISVSGHPPTPTPTATPTALPAPPMPGYNSECRAYGTAIVCASISEPFPALNSTVTVYGRLLVNGLAQQGRLMSSHWYMTRVTAWCTGLTNAGGAAQCDRVLRQTDANVLVTVEVNIIGYVASTHFTPR